MPITLSEDEIDDLLYFARTGDSEEFHKLKDELFAREGLKGEGALAGLLTAAKDEESGNGVLHMAAANGYEGLLKELCKGLSQPTPQNPTMLAILNAQNKAGNTPLHWAALNGHLESVKVLLEEGSDPTITNQRGHDAVYEAELNDKKEIVEWVLKEGGEGLESALGGDAGEGPSGGDGDNEAEEDIDVVDVGEDGKLEDGLKDLKISGDKP